MTLSNKQRAFIEAYLTHWNATKAAIEAGYSERSASSISSETLGKPEVVAAIKARLTEMTMSADEVLTRLTDHARGSIAPFLDINADGGVRGFKLGTDQPVQLVRRATHTRRTYKDGSKDDSVTIELHDSQAALALLGKHHGLFIERHEITGKDGGPIALTPVDYRAGLDALKPDDADA